MVLPLGLGVVRLLPEERGRLWYVRKRGSEGDLGPGRARGRPGSRFPFMFRLSSPPTPLLPAREMLRKEQPLTLRSALARRANCSWSDIPTMMTVFW